MLSAIQKYYSTVFLFFLISIIGLSLYVGYQQGSSTAVASSVALECSDAVLKKQAIVVSKELELEEDISSEEAVSFEDIPATLNTQQAGLYVGSKNGTKYYTPGCPGTTRIKSSNYIWFETAEDAIVQGYSKGSC